MLKTSNQPFKSSLMKYRRHPHHPPINTHPVHNRIRSFMEHSTAYAFMGEVRLAKDCGVSCAAISRLLAGKSSPSFALLVRITQAFERQFEHALDPREIVSLDGDYPTPTVCEIVGCRGCTPQSAWNEDDTLKQGVANLQEV
jgi:transcriptional regulator with XRE-family HTH domain